MSDSFEVQKADPAARRIAVAALIGGAVLGALLLTIAPPFRPQFEMWVREHPETRLRIVLAVFALLAIAPLLGFAAYLWSIGHRIDDSGRYPPPGARLLQDTRVLRGDAAAHRARLARAFAAMLIAAGFILGFLLWRLATLLDPS